MTAPTASGAARPAGARGRGRPVQFDADAQAAFLAAVTAGAKLGEAAVKAGVSRNVPSQHAKTDSAFRAALDEAKARGRAVRAAARPHGETHYNHDGCRTEACRAKATTARTARRHTAHDSTPADARPIQLNAKPDSSPLQWAAA